jgi:hypothetical protein
VTFKITIGSKSNNDRLKFNGDFKSHPTFRRTRVLLLPLLLKERGREE